ncbi:hypothetical protein Q7P35_004034 [Cladosporium inversicolor]
MAIPRLARDARILITLAVTISSHPSQVAPNSAAIQHDGMSRTAPSSMIALAGLWAVGCGLWAVGCGLRGYDGASKLARRASQANERAVRAWANINISDDGYLRTCRLRYDGVSSHRTDGRSDLISRRDESRQSRHTDRPSSGLQEVTRLERDGMSRVGGDVSKLFSPLLFRASAALLLLPCRGAGCHQRRQANGGRERHEARGSLAEVKVNLPPPARAKKARKEDKASSRRARRKRKLLVCSAGMQSQLARIGRDGGIYRCETTAAASETTTKDVHTIYTNIPPSPTTPGTITLHTYTFMHLFHFHFQKKMAWADPGRCCHRPSGARTLARISVTTGDWDSIPAFR